MGGVVELNTLMSVRLKASEAPVAVARSPETVAVMTTRTGIYVAITTSRRNADRKDRERLEAQIEMDVKENPGRN